MNRRTFCHGGVLAAAGMIAQPSLASGQPMKLVIGSAHAGFLLKGPVIELLRSRGHTLDEMGRLAQMTL